MPNKKIKHCPTCKEAFAWSDTNSSRPFCSERCKLIDLGEWFDEEHSISEPIAIDEDLYH